MPTTARQTLSDGQGDHDSDASQEEDFKADELEEDLGTPLEEMIDEPIEIPDDSFEVESAAGSSELDFINVPDLDSDATPLEKPDAQGTIEHSPFDTMPNAELPPAFSGEPTPPADPRATHTFETDRTVDLPEGLAGAEVPPRGPDDPRLTQTPLGDATIDLGGATAADAEQIGLNWSDSCDLSTGQHQTIRQKETIVGDFRSSLPVKSREVRQRHAASESHPISLADVPDYELLDVIGEGGMGVVYAAHQSSIARTVAVKMLKPGMKIGAEQRDKFISEAVVTGDLDHPNIVPIYDMGANRDGALFYSMKRVRGTPWDDVIGSKSVDENLNILMRVADAVAFAHAGGVVHRDLKPENVMLGDFGEVLVMDWGLARITAAFANRDSVYQSDNLGGTPAYMAPEMARGPVDEIDARSDVYLLGAILYEIIGGKPPHSGRDVMNCLVSAAANRIDPIEYEGELLEIALRAMATRKEDRYASVKEFQEAVRLYQSHSESLVLTTHAERNLQAARDSGDYQLYARALYGFQESLALWEGNERAAALLIDVQHDYAQNALGKGDLDLAASLLDPAEPEHAGLSEQIASARRERDARQRRLNNLKRVAAALVVGIIAVISVAYFNVRAAKLVAEEQRGIAVQEREEAERQEGIAVEQREIAEEQRGIAVQEREEAERQRMEAERQSGIAEEQRQEAESQRNEAVTQRQRADEAREIAVEAREAEEYEAYIARIGLAAAKIDENAYDYALELLQECPPELRNWEWGRLLHLSLLNTRSFESNGPVDAVAYSPDGTRFISGNWDGQATIRDLDTGNVIHQFPQGQYVHAVDWSRDGSRVATGSSDRLARILDAQTGQELHTLSGHTDAVLSVQFSPDGRLLATSGYDGTIRLWDTSTGRELQVLQGHTWWVWTATFSPDGRRIVSAGQDGKAVVWQRDGEAATGGGTSGGNAASFVPFRKLTEFYGHDGAVYSAAFSSNGNQIATGGYDKTVKVWNPDAVQPIDMQRRLDGQGQAAVEFTTLSGHTGPVRSVAFSPSREDLVLSGSYDNSLRLWNSDSGQLIKTLRGHGGRIASCTFSPDGLWVLSGGYDERVRLWDVEGYQEERVLDANLLRGHADAVLSARFSPDGSRVVTASRDRTANLWQADTGELIRRFAEGHEFLATSAEFFPDGRRLATGAGDNSVRIWDVATGTEVLELTPTGRIGALAVSPDGRRVATGGANNEAQVWDVATGQRTATLPGHLADVTAIAFSPDGALLATGDDRGRIFLWRQAAGAGWQQRGQLEGHSRTITDLRFLPDGSRLISASGDNTCGQWDLARGAEIRSLVLRHPDWVTDLDLSSDGRFAVTTCDDGVARLWSLADARVVRELPALAGSFNAVSLAPDDRTALLTSAADRRVRLWRLADSADAQSSMAPAARSFGAQASGRRTVRANQLVGIPAAAGRMLQSGTSATFASQAADDAAPILLDFQDLGGQVWSAVFSPDGNHLLTIGGDDARLWRIDTREPLVSFSQHGAVASASISPNGRLIATGSWDHSAKIWDAQTGRAIRKLEGAHTGYVNSAEFSPGDGRVLLTASDDGTARLWDIETSQPLDVVFRGHAARITEAVFSPDGQRVLTASGDQTARIWDRATGRQQLELSGHEWAVLCGAFSRDGTRVVTGSEDNSARIWNAATGELLVTLAGHTAAVSSVAFSPDGARVLTGSQDNTAKLWDARTGKEILSLTGHVQEVTSVAFSPDGRNALTASRDGTAIIWLAEDWSDQQAVQAMLSAAVR